MKVAPEGVQSVVSAVGPADVLGAGVDEAPAVAADLVAASVAELVDPAAPAVFPELLHAATSSGTATREVA